MRRNLAFILSACTFVVGVVAVVLLYGIRAEQKVEADRKRAEREFQQRQDEAALESAREDLAQLRKERKERAAAKEQERGDFGRKHVNRFLEDLKLKGTRHEARVRARFLALDYEEQEQALSVAGYVHTAGLEHFKELDKPSWFEKENAFYRRHPELFPEP